MPKGTLASVKRQAGLARGKRRFLPAPGRAVAPGTASTEPLRWGVAPLAVKRRPAKREARRGVVDSSRDSRRGYRQTPFLLQLSEQQSALAVQGAPAWPQMLPVQPLVSYWQLEPHASVPPLKPRLTQVSASGTPGSHCSPLSTMPLPH